MSGTSTDVSIVGVGLHRFGRHDPALTGMAMGAQASRLALADAGVSWADIGYAVGGSNVSGKPDTLVSVLGLTGVPFVNVRNGCATAGVALATAANVSPPGRTAFTGGGTSSCQPTSSQPDQANDCPAQNAPASGAVS